MSKFGRAPNVLFNVLQNRNEVYIQSDVTTSSQSDEFVGGKTVLSLYTVPYPRTGVDLNGNSLKTHF